MSVPDRDKTEPDGRLVIPEDLVRAAANDLLTIIVGAGASRPAFPSWNELLDSLWSEAIATAEARSDHEAEQDLKALKGKISNPPETAQVLGRVMGMDWLRQELSLKFTPGSKAPTATHLALARIPGATFVTTNFDDLLERALGKEGAQPPTVVRVDEPGKMLGLVSGDVLKLHGDASTPESLVFALDDYQRQQREIRQAWRHRLAALFQHPVLLVGYGFDDPDVQDVIDDLRVAFGPDYPRPWWLHRKDVIAKYKAENRRLRPIWLEDWGQLPAWLDALARKARAARDATLPSAAVHIDTWKRLGDEALDAIRERASSLFSAAHYEEARQVWSELETKLGAVDGAPDLAVWRARARLSQAACLLNTGETTSATEILTDLVSSDLPVGMKAKLALMFLIAGRNPEAERLLEALGKSCSPEEDRAIAIARQVALLRRGERPVALVDDPQVIIEAVRLEFERGDLQAAWDALLPSTCDLDASSPAELVSLVRVLLAILQRAVSEHPLPKRTVQVTDRPALLQTIEKALERIADNDSSGNPPPPSAYAELGMLYHSQIDEQEQVKHFQRLISTGASSGGWRFAGAIEKAGHAADKGDWPGVEALLSGVEPQWLGIVQHAGLLDHHGRREEAIQRLEDARTRWPDLPKIEASLGLLKLKDGKAGEALPHLESATLLLPSRVNRLLLAWARYQRGDLGQAWALVASEEDWHPWNLANCVEVEHRAEWLRVRALAAVANGHRDLAWESLVALVADEKTAMPTDHYMLAMQGIDGGRYLDAKRHAALALGAFVERIGSMDLGQAAQLVQIVFQAGVGATDGSLLLDVARTLRQRFAGDTQAEAVRMLILGRLDFPGSEPPPDWRRLAAAQVVLPVNLENVAKKLHAARTMTDRAWDLYTDGHLSFDNLVSLLNRPAALLFTELITGTPSAPQTNWLAAPLRLDMGEVPKLRNLLLGPLELLLLQDLRLLDTLSHMLGTSGHIVLFSDHAQALEEAPRRLSTVAQDVALQTIRALLAEERVAWTRWPGTEPPPDDENWCQERGLRLIDVDPQSPSTLGLLDLAEALHAAGLMERSQVQLLESRGRRRAGKDPALLPDKVALTGWAVKSLADVGLLESFLTATARHIVVPPMATQSLERRRAALELGVVALERARDLHRWVKSTPQVRVIDRPAWCGLPSTKDGTPNQESARQMLLPDLAGFQALADDTDLVMVTADARTGDLAAGDSGLFAAGGMAFGSVEEVAIFTEGLRNLGRRCLHLPELVDRLPLADEQRILTEERLCSLGFLHPLSAERLVDLVRRYGGLDKGIPGNILDRVEWRIRRGQTMETHEGAMELGRRFAAAAWSGWMGRPEAGGLGLMGADRSKSLPQPLRTHLARGIIARIEGFEKPTSVETEQQGPLFLSLLHFFLHGLLVRLLADPVAVFKKHEERPEALTLDLAGEPAALWGEILPWVHASPMRRAVFGYTCRQVLVEWSQDPEFMPKDAAWQSRLMALLSPVHHHQTLLSGLGMDDPVVEAMAILSACWDWRPLQELRVPMPGVKESDTLSLEQILHLGAEALATQDPQRALEKSTDGRFWSWTLNRAGIRLRIHAPLEALVLRLPPERLVALAEELAGFQGPDDGRLAELLLALRDDPGNRDLREHYARRALTSPLRTVRDDPTLLRFWGGLVWRPGDEGLLQEIRGLLSESPLGREGSMHEELLQRVQPGGCWAQRPDRRDLFERAATVPGRLALLWGLEPTEPTLASAEVRQWVDTALSVITHPAKHSAGQLASSLATIFASAARQVKATLGDRTVELAAHLPTLISRVLENLAEEPDIDAFAGVETPLLRLCSSVVHRAAQSSGENLPSREILWLTWRLFNWSYEQLVYTSPAHHAAIQGRLQAMAPPATPATDDALDPQRLGFGRFDHRLASVLYVISNAPLALSGPLAPRLGREQKAVEQDLRFYSQTMRTQLLTLATRDLRPEEQQMGCFDGNQCSALGWTGLAAVPHLALWLLLTRDAEALSDMRPADRLERLDEISARIHHVPYSTLAEFYLIALAQIPAVWSDQEHERLSGIAQREDTGGLGRQSWLWLLFALWRRGEEGAKDRLLERLPFSLDDRAGKKIFAESLELLARTDPPGFEEFLVRVLAESAKTNGSPSVIAIALGRTATCDNAEARALAREHLGRLVVSGSVGRDLEVRELLYLLGMEIPHE